MTIPDRDEKWNDSENEKNKVSCGVKFLHKDEGKFFEE